MSKKKKPIPPSSPARHRPWAPWVIVAAITIWIGWGDDIGQWYNRQTDARAIRAHNMPLRLDGLTRISRLTDEPFDVFCLLMPKQTAVGEEASLLETSINAAIQEKFPRGVPDNQWAFVYANAQHVRIDTYEQEIAPFHFAGTNAVQDKTMTSFMDDVTPATCARRDEAGFFTFPSRRVILVRY